MKKRNLLVSFVLMLALMITACGEPSPFAGTWRGTCDITNLVIGESILSSDESLSEYADLIQGLDLVMNFEFTEDKMSMSVDDACVDTFIANLETSMKNMYEAYMIDQLAEYGISYEEYLEELGMNSDTLTQQMLDEMDMSAQMRPMLDSMVEALELNGSYMYDDEKITIVFEDNTYEELDYVLEDGTLTITFVDAEGTEFPFVCEFQK